MAKFTTTLLAGCALLLTTVPAFAQGTYSGQQWEPAQQQQQQPYYQGQQPQAFQAQAPAGQPDMSPYAGMQVPGLQQQPGTMYGNANANGSMAQQQQQQPPGAYLQGQPGGYQGQVSASASDPANAPPNGDIAHAPHHSGLKSAAGSMGKLLGRGVQVAAPVAGGLMMMKAAGNMAGMGGMGGMGMMAPMMMGSGMYGGMGMPYGGYPAYGYNPAASMMAPALMGTGMNMMMNAGR
ncbi:MAG TPA: hypothetical protein V6C72_16415 [Chroococcales cyanobacterium]